ncbi:MAG: SprB repeat-containing protein, partial [Chitinophagales bacterium]|nr:SprB repeat-containing protein [Chitinophagales bacterium]
MIKYLLSKYFILLLLISLPLFSNCQNGLDIIEGPIHIISCDSTCTMLHANFPKPLKTNQYSVSSIPYSPTSITGTTINLLDDKFSNAVPIGFNFCFFENVFTQCYIADNGVLTFNPAYSGGSCNNNTQQVLPYFNSTFPDNAIFFMYMDIAPTLGGTIKYATIGTAPFRKFIISYQNVRIFGLTCSANTSSFQVVLSESTNLIDIHVTSKIGCDNNVSNYANYGTIGIQDAGATAAFTAPGKHASIFTMNNESIRIAPSGIPNYLLKWRDALNNVIATNVDSIYFCPPSIPYNKIRAEINFYCPAATFKDSVIIDKNIPDITNISIIPPLCNGDSSGMITVTAIGFTPPLLYAINGGPFSSNNVFTNITNGFYYISVKDANGCRKDSLIQVFPQYNVAAIVDSIIRPTCPDSNGKIYLHPANGVPPYTISWSNGMTGSPITGLTQGVYVVTITDANGCTTNASITLQFDSIPELVYSVTKPVCHDSSGAIYLTITNGTLPYQFLWNTGATTQNVTNLMSGTYSVLVTDINGCSVNAIILLPDTLAVETLDTVLQNTSCGLNNGIAKITASFGLPPYTYSWMPGGQTTATATGLAAGIYTITTTDASNCSEIDTLTILPSLALINSVSKANANCDSSNGKIYLNNVFNWTGWVDTLWSTGGTSSIVTGLAPGTYWVKTTDSLGCVKTDTISLTNDGKPFLGLVSYTQPLCYGDSTGSITLTGSSGTSPYKYSIDGINFTSIAQINNIAGGTYTIYITDANSCPNDTVVFFNQPTQIISNYKADTVICYADATSTIEINTTGGFPPYLYAFNGGSYNSQSIYSNLKQGSYPYFVKDSIGCEVIFNAIVP